MIFKIQNTNKKIKEGDNYIYDYRYLGVYKNEDLYSVKKSTFLKLLKQFEIVKYTNKLDLENLIKLLRMLLKVEKVL